MPRTRVWIALHAVFAAVAVIVLAAPLADTGLEVLALVVGYHVGVVATARITDDQDLWTAWSVLAPMSVLMVLPDWFLSDVLGTLVFPDTGAPFIGTVPVFMAGMWTVALLPLALIGRAVESKRGIPAAFFSVAVAGLALFCGAEYLAPAIPLWEPTGAALVGGVAVYVLLPELGLCLAMYALVRGAAARSRWATAGGIIAVPFMYLGMLATSYQFLG